MRSRLAVCGLVSLVVAHLSDSTSCSRRNRTSSRNGSPECCVRNDRTNIRCDSGSILGCSQTLRAVAVHVHAQPVNLSGRNALSAINNHSGSAHVVQFSICKPPSSSSSRVRFIGCMSPSGRPAGSIAIAWSSVRMNLSAFSSTRPCSQPGAPIYALQLPNRSVPYNNDDNSSRETTSVGVQERPKLKVGIHTTTHSQLPIRSRREIIGKHCSAHTMLGFTSGDPATAERARGPLATATTLARVNGMLGLGPACNVNPRRLLWRRRVVTRSRRDSRLTIPGYCSTRIF